MAEYLELNRDDSGEAGSWGKSRPITGRPINPGNPINWEPQPHPPRQDDGYGDDNPHKPHKPCRWSWHLGKHMWRLLLFFVIVLVIYRSLIPFLLVFHKDQHSDFLIF